MVCFDGPRVFLCLSTDGGPNVTLYNNSKDNMYEYQPPRPFRVDIFFALEWDRNTDWSRNRDQVNLTIKCDRQVVYVSPQLHHPNCITPAPQILLGAPFWSLVKPTRSPNLEQSNMCPTCGGMPRIPFAPRSICQYRL